MGILGAEASSGVGSKGMPGQTEGHLPASL